MIESKVVCSEGATPSVLGGWLRPLLENLCGLGHLIYWHR